VVTITAHVILAIATNIGQNKECAAAWKDTQESHGDATSNVIPSTLVAFGNESVSNPARASNPGLMAGLAGESKGWQG